MTLLSGHHVAGRAPGAVCQGGHGPQDQVQGPGQPRSQHRLAKGVCGHLKR